MNQSSPFSRVASSIAQDRGIINPVVRFLQDTPSSREASVSSISKQELEEVVFQGCMRAVEALLPSRGGITLESMRFPEEPSACPFYVLVGSVYVGRYVEGVLKKAQKDVNSTESPTRASMKDTIDAIYERVSSLFLRFQVRAPWHR